VSGQRSGISGVAGGAGVVRGSVWFDGGAAFVSVAWEADSPGRLRGSVAVPRARPWTLWTEGAPFLHTVCVELGTSDGMTARFGLRQLGTTSDGRLTLNGAPLKLRGYNRHTMAPDTGSALSLERANPSRRPLRDAYFLSAQAKQTAEMAGASLSHPSVLIHSFLNAGAQRRSVCMWRLRRLGRSRPLPCAAHAPARLVARGPRRPSRRRLPRARGRGLFQRLPELVRGRL